MKTIANPGTGPELPSPVAKPAVSALANAKPPLGRYRWVICALLFFATTINYMDRQVLGLLAPVLQREIGWNEIQYGNIVAAFQAAYAVGLLIIGGLIDRLGTRIGYALAIAVWSLASMGHALARSAFGFGVARAALGLGESGNFPAAIKTVAEWFPRKERAYATGLFNSGANIGAIAAPLFVPWVTVHYGWRVAFLLTGLCGLPWIFLWLRMYRRPREHPSLSAEELAYIESDPPDKVVKVPWLRLLPHRQTWTFVVAKFLTDPIWWFFLYWLPKFLNTEHGLTLDKLGLPLVVVYLVSDGGSIFGGWFSSFLIQRGVPLNRARKSALLLFAVTVTPIVFASRVGSLWGAVALVCLATASHQAWSANEYTIVSDMFPRSAVASVVGLGGFGGSIGGILFAQLAGHILQLTHSYFPLFAIGGSAYLVAFLLIQLLAPRLEPVSLPFSAG
jgi:ACS family hexuronate transporter-like MFS transporter